ncbi:MAG: TrbI/VirB10 family protein, partial [Crocosphaera sp.]
VTPRSQSRMVAQNVNQDNNLGEEERFLLGNTASQQITIGQRAIAILESSLISESNRSQNDFVERFVVTLTTPLTNHQGDVILPTGTPMLVAVRSVHDSGKVTAIVESVVKNGQEIPLPDGAMFLRDQGGNPLMASLVQSGQPERMAANATTFVMGALSKTGELLNQGETSTFISGGNFSQTQQFNEPNYIGGLLEGGFTPLAERMNEQHENRLSHLDSRTPLWMVELGTTVEIFVNQTIRF